MATGRTEWNGMVGGWIVMGEERNGKGQKRGAEERGERVWVWVSKRSKEGKRRERRGGVVKRSILV